MPGSNERLVDVVTPLGDKLWFRQMSGTEALSTLFEFDVTFHSDKKEIKAKTILGLGVTLKVETQDLGVRHFNGICTRFSSGGREGDHYVYTAKLRPWLWLASRRSDCKIFQNKTVPEIIDDVLKNSGEYDFPIKQSLIKTYRQWEYCVQYQETDLNFVMRLMEHEGIYFYFKHEDGVHTLTLVDDMSRHLPMPERPTIIYSGVGAAAVEREEHFDSWHLREEVDSGEYSSDDYDFMKPNANLKTANASPMGHAEDGRQRYEWPGGYIVHGDGDQYARVRMETLVAEQERALGHCSLRTMAPGYTFNLERCPQREQNREYLAVAATYFFRDNVRRSVGSGDGDVTWGVSVTSQPVSIPYRPQLLTSKPRTHGPQTALVVGPAGKEIHTEKYGRVKVQFHWDRVGQKNENSSCFIRVATPLAGGKWGMIQIPRIGQEVIVDFLCGDPDQPIIIGSVYNEAQPVPYELPKYEATATWKSHSTPGGTPKDYNEFRFDDRIGKEQVFIHAQRRMDVRVKRNKYETVQGASYTSIGGAHGLTIGGTLDLHIKDAVYAKADAKVEVGIGGDLLFDVGGSAKLHVKQDLQQNALSILMEGKTSITLKCGGSYVKIGPEGVTIQGPIVKINCGGGAPGATGFDITEPLDAEGSDTGEPGYLENRPRGGGGRGRNVRHVDPERARAITRNADGSVNYGGAGVRISGSPAFVNRTVATLDSLDGTQTGHQLINNLETNNHTASIVENNAAATAGGGGVATMTTANGHPAGTRVNMGGGNIQTSDGSGSDSTVNWIPGHNAPYTDSAGVVHTQPDEALLGHELNHADHNAHGNNRSGTPDPHDATGDQEESTTIGINDHANEPVSENNILRDMGENWRRTDHDSTAKATP